MTTRGRVIAIDGDAAIIRTDRADLRVAGVPARWRPGDLVAVDQLKIIRRGAPRDYPTPGTEVMRVPRERLDALRVRAAVLARVREFFAQREFLEVDTPLIVPTPGLEIHLDAIEVGKSWLITSPEYQMKRLLAAGIERIYQVCKCFRANERGVHHSNEFTMLEWYRGYSGLDAIIADLEQLVFFACAGRAYAGGRPIDVTPPWRRITVREAMRYWAGVEVDGAESAEELVGALLGAGIEVAADAAWDDAFFAAFLARVEPALAALDQAVILEDWPAPLAALARRKDGKTALRFEAYVGGIELANAFDELVDPAEQRARFLEDQRVRASRGKPVYPIDEKLLAALAEGLPPSAGIALGLDRLVMLACGASTIDQVLAFTAEEL